MPGHKGREILGIEAFDITEISGADVLYSPTGIIAESEENATAIFGTAHSFYSTEGSTLAIKAMLRLVSAGDVQGERALILAGRNAHKSFVYAVALLDLDVEWLFGDEGSHICECQITPEALEAALSKTGRRPAAVYITSPDYLGNIADIRGLCEVADRYGIPLLVDNAHGAYLKFLTPSLHPIDLGASMCADSAHKTLPVLTGGAYLHIAKKADRFVDGARGALSLFASTSPSYLTLQSLDLANAALSDGYRERLFAVARRAEDLKKALRSQGFSVCDTEPLKIVISTASYGYTGDGIADILRKNNVECEFSDRDYIVFMLTAENAGCDFEDLCRLAAALSEIPRRSPLTHTLPRIPACERKMTVREAIFAKCETVASGEAVGRILASPTVSCPPAVPVLTSGEELTEEAVAALLYYGIDKVEVVKMPRRLSE